MPNIVIALTVFVCVGFARRLQTFSQMLPVQQTVGIDRSLLRKAYALLLGTIRPSAFFNPAGVGAFFHAARPGYRFPLVSMESERGPDPEDWRTFRAKMIRSGIKVTGEDDNETTAEQKPLERISVAPANEETLKEQNEELWKEYMQGAWAHETSIPEVGGLICRLSMEAQLIRLMRADPNCSALAKCLHERLCSQLPSDAESSDAQFQVSLTSWSSNTFFMYRLAERMKIEYDELFRESVVDGVLDVSKQTDELKEFVWMYSSWSKDMQSVALVLEKGSPNTKVSRCVKLNRPALSKGSGLSRRLAERLLNGVNASSPEYDDAFVDRFMEAFGEQPALYVGGRDNQNAPVMLLHGYDLPGAKEIAPGTGIYSGGIRAAVDAVLAKERSPLDFRWFVGDLQGPSVEDHEWTSIACARSLALKQCLRLPKPLWHEVMQLCGGDLKTFSDISLQKRKTLDSF